MGGRGAGFHGARFWRHLWRPVTRGWKDVLFSLVLGVGYLLLLLGSVDSLGYTRDEGFYFEAANSYQQWFELLWRDSAAALATVDRYWRVNHEHPALLKSLFAFSHMWLHQRGGWFAWEGTSYRFPAMVMAGLALAVTYLWGTRAGGRLVGLLAALWLAAMPRFFFHAHLACFDVPVVTSWLLCAYAYWLCLQRGGVLAPLWCGVAFALALNTKHNAWFLPIVCGLHMAWLWFLATRGGAHGKLLWRRARAALLSMAVLGPALFYLLWPWLWHDTAARLIAYVQFHLGHVYYNMEFLGQNYFRPPMPRLYAPLMTVATVPVITLAAFALALLTLSRRALRQGMTAWRKRRRRRAAGASGTDAQSRRDAVQSDAQTCTWMFWGLAMAVQWLPWARSTTPIFGGTKHWLGVYPFLCLLAATFAVRAGRQAIGWLRRRITPRWGRLLAARLALTGGMMALWLAPPMLQTAHSHPWELSWYNALVGGPAGGATLGLNRGFWGHTSAALLAHLNHVVPLNGRVFIHDTALPSWRMLVREGRVRQDIVVVANLAQADVAIYHHELHMRGVEQQAWVAFDTVAPDVIAGLDGVPVVWCYRRRGVGR